MKCNVCLKEKLDEVISLDNYPLNSLYLTEIEIQNRGKYKARDMSLYVCNSCGHFQAISEVQLNEFYNDDYSYNTQNSGVQGRITYFLSQLSNIADIKFNRIIDVGCYDLSLIKEVKKKIVAKYYIGVDPSIPPRLLDNEDGIICFKDYIDRVDLPYFDKGLPDLIISDQTFEHIPSINLVLSNINQKVGNNSIFAICVPSLEILIEKLNFHNLIHEHVNYFSINSLAKLFELNNITLKSCSLNYISTCGFLFGLFSKGEYNVSGKELNENKVSKDHFLYQYELFNISLSQTKKLIDRLRGERIFGFGASDITANLAYFMNSDFSFLTNIFDDTEYKQGKYIPFLKPRIVNQKDKAELQNSNCLITSPQAARYIYSRIMSLDFNRIINPLGLIA